MGGDDPVLNNQNYINPRDMAAMPVEATSGFTCTWTSHFNVYIDDTFFFPEIYIVPGSSLKSPSRSLMICIAKSASKSISLMTDDSFQRFTSKSFYIHMTPSHDFGNPYIAIQIEKDFKKERVTIRIFLYLPNGKYPGGIVVSLSVNIRKTSNLNRLSMWKTDKNIILK